MVFELCHCYSYVRLDLIHHLVSLLLLMLIISMCSVQNDGSLKPVIDLVKELGS